MLSSQISSISSSSISPLLIQSSTTMLRSTTTVVPRRHTHHQTRTMRFGLWSSYPDPSFQREFHRRHRAMRRKYMDACNRKLPWNRPNQATAKQLGLKDSMCSGWSRHGSRSSGRWVTIEELNDAIKNEQKQNNGIESPEQSAFDKLLNRRDGLHNLFQARSRALRDGLVASSFLHHPASSQTGSHAHTSGKAAQSETGTNSEPEYDIDPITNKKVYRKPADTFKGYRSQFQSDPTREILKASETEPYKPYFAYEPDGKIPNPAEDGQQDFDAIEPYKPYFAYEPDGKIPEPVQEGLKEYEAGVSYEPYFAYEPDGKLPHQSQDGLKEYEAGISYEPYFAYEPDGKIPDGKISAQNGLKEYDARVSYEPYFAYEPDGKIPDGKISQPAQDGLQEYDARVSYGPYFAYEPDGKISDGKILQPAQDGLQEYEAGVSYGPYFAYEPDGKIPQPAQDGLQEYETGVSYEPYFAYEPDGKIHGSVARATSPAAAQKASDVYPVQEGLKDYDMKASYGPVMYQEPDGKLPETPCQESSKAYDNATSYKPRTVNVRREEAVFSGKSNWAGGTKKSHRKKKVTGRNMLLGAAWLGGLSYTLGVVAEYFKTGGADGLGPQGF